MTIDLRNIIFLSHLHEFKSLAHLIGRLYLLDIRNKISDENESELNELIAEGGYFDCFFDALNQPCNHHGNITK